MNSLLKKEKISSGNLIIILLDYCRKNGYNLINIVMYNKEKYTVALNDIFYYVNNVSVSQNENNEINYFIDTKSECFEEYLQKIKNCFCENKSEIENYKYLFNKIKEHPYARYDYMYNPLNLYNYIPKTEIEGIKTSSILIKNLNLIEFSTEVSGKRIKRTHTEQNLGSEKIINLQDIDKIELLDREIGAWLIKDDKLIEILHSLN